MCVFFWGGGYIYIYNCPIRKWRAAQDSWQWIFSCSRWLTWDLARCGGCWSSFMSWDSWAESMIRDTCRMVRMVPVLKSLASAATGSNRQHAELRCAFWSGSNRLEAEPSITGRILTCSSQWWIFKLENALSSLGHHLILASHPQQSALCEKKGGYVD